VGCTVNCLNLFALSIQNRIDDRNCFTSSDDNHKRKLCLALITIGHSPQKTTKTDLRIKHILYTDNTLQDKDKLKDASISFQTDMPNTL
jgi:hypothetical protein